MSRPSTGEGAGEGRGPNNTNASVRLVECCNLWKEQSSTVCEGIPYKGKEAGEGKEAAGEGEGGRRG